MLVLRCVTANYWVFPFKDPSVKLRQKCVPTKTLKKDIVLLRAVDKIIIADELLEAVFQCGAVLVGSFSKCL